MQKVTKEINLVSIKDNHLKTRYEAAVFTTGDTHVVTYENATPVHSDLAAAVQRLSDHVLKISGITAKPDHIHITGYQRQNMGDACRCGSLRSGQSCCPYLYRPRRI